MTPPKEFVCLLLLFAACGFASAQGTSALDKLTQAQWRDDVRYLAQEMPKVHKDLFHSMTREEFLNAVASLDAKILQLNTDETLVEISRLLTMVGDDHSGYLEPLSWDSNSNYPLKLVWYESGIYVQRAPRQHSDLVGGRVIKIGNKTVEQALKEISEIFPHDCGNLAHVHVLGVPLYLTQSRVLHGLHIEPTNAEATYVIEKGGRETAITMRPVASTALIRSRSLPEGWTDSALQSSDPLPLWMQHPERNLWFEYLPDGHALYFQFNEVNDEETETIEQFAHKLFQFLGSHNVTKVIIDLRNNLGGDNTKLRPLIVGLLRLPNINRRGRLFVIIGPSTHSAAQSFVDRLENYSEAIFVGEPSGQNVNFFSDSEDIVLTNSSLHIAMSQLWWEDAGPLDKRSATNPEIAVTNSFADYVNHADPVLQTILRRSDFPTFDEVLTGALTKSEDALVAAYRSWASDPIHRYFDTEDKAGELGFRLLRGKELQKAIMVFRANVELHPDSSNALDNLGYGYVRLGDKSHAIDAYNKALSLNPKDERALRSLDRLRVR